jgi:hypothetical protein
MSFRDAWFPPADHVSAARRDERLQAEHVGDVEQAKRELPGLSCPSCGSTELVWLWFSSPPATWERLCGTAGPLAWCDPCERRVEYVELVMN